MAQELYGIKETQEAAVAVLDIAGEVAVQLKDGVQLNDFEAFYLKLTTDEAFKASVKAGYEGIKEVPLEVKDLSVMEGVQLISSLTPKVLDLISKLK